MKRFCMLIALLVLVAGCTPPPPLPATPTSNSTNSPSNTTNSPSNTTTSPSNTTTSPSNTTTAMADDVQSGAAG